MKRLLFFGYGVVSYLIFLGTFLYAIAFVGGLPVPTRLDGPLEGSIIEALAIDCALLTIFAVQHSVMARRWFKERWTQIVPWAIERSTYVLFASLALILLFCRSGGQSASRSGRSTTPPRGSSSGRCAPPAGRTVLIVTFLINHFDLFGLQASVAAADGPAVHARVVPHAIAVSLRPASPVSRLPACVLDDADDDARASGVCGGDDGVHRAGHPVRGA